MKSKSLPNIKISLFFLSYEQGNSAENGAGKWLCKIYVNMLIY